MQCLGPGHCLRLLLIDLAPNACYFYMFTLHVHSHKRKSTRNKTKAICMLADLYMRKRIVDGNATAVVGLTENASKD
jgi:hypothetical protein